MAYQKDVGPAEGILSALMIMTVVMLFSALCYEGYTKIREHKTPTVDECPRTPQGHRQDCDEDSQR